MPQIVAMGGGGGGGGFSMEPDNPLLDRYVLEISRSERPAVCFLPPASGDAEGYINGFYAAFDRFPCRPSHLSLFKPPKADLRSFILDQDVIYVGGGNTRNLLVLWREWGLDRFLREAWEAGVVLSGISAGMICWFETGMTDSTPGLTDAAVGDGYAAEDGVALHFIGDDLARVVSSRPDARAYRVERRGETVVETPLPSISLDDSTLLS